MHIPEGYGEASLVFTSADLPNGAVVTVGFENVAVGTAGFCAANFVNSFATHVLPEVPSRINLDHVKVKLGPNDTGPDAIYASGADGAGDATTIIPNCALIVRKFTAHGGRTGRGRFFWPVVSENALGVGGLITDTYVNNFVNVVEAWRADMITRDLPLALLHSAAGEPPYFINGVGGEALLGTQRRRTGR